MMTLPHRIKVATFEGKELVSYTCQGNLNYSRGFNPFLVISAQTFSHKSCLQKSKSNTSFFVSHFVLNEQKFVPVFSEKHY
jgi:hypothetical protein